SVRIKAQPSPSFPLPLVRIPDVLHVPLELDLDEFSNALQSLHQLGTQVEKPSHQYFKFKGKERPFTVSTIELASVPGAEFVYRETCAAGPLRRCLPMEQNRSEHTTRSGLGRRL